MRCDYVQGGCEHCVKASYNGYGQILTSYKSSTPKNFHLKIWYACL